MTLPAASRVALYARVSSDRQADEGTIASQLDALRQRLATDGHTLDDELCFVDDGVSGATLLRPALERLRDQAAANAFDALYVYAPDRLARHDAYQFLRVEELRRVGVQVVFLNRPLGQSAEDNLLLQIQGIIAEYERIQIRERARRGKLHAARAGRVSVLTTAPYGYRYLRKQEGGGTARLQVLLEEARVVQQIFHWVGDERLSLGAVVRRLHAQQITTRTGQPRWSRAALAYLLRNPAYMGEALYGKTRNVERQPRLRPPKGRPVVPRRPHSVTRQDTQPIPIAVPALVSAALFAAVGAQLAENRQRRRQRPVASYRLQGLLVCRACGYAWTGLTRRWRLRGGETRQSSYYRCCGRQMGGAGERACAARQVAAVELDEAVWQDVCRILSDPAGVAAEYQRRHEGADAAGPSVEPLSRVLEATRRTIGRLIDGYAEGLLSKEEFEPRLWQAKEKLRRLQEEASRQAEAETARQELRLVIGCLEEFAARIGEGLTQAEWPLRRELIRALVSRVEVDDEQVRIVYRLGAVPFVEGPEGGLLQDCWKRQEPFPGG